jgi:hypothetical protein
MFQVGTVVKYNVGNPAVPPVVVADSFLQFLLIAGNLQEISSKYDDPGQALPEFKEYLAPLVAGRQDQMESTWMEIAHVALS